MRTLPEVQAILRAHKEALRERFGVKGLALFGSVARGEAGEGSDLDLLVELERPLGWEMVDLHRYLEEILGMPVDLVTPGALKRKPLLERAIREDLIHV